MDSNSVFNIERFRKKFESDEHWNLKREFILAHKDKFPEERLICLAQTYLNIKVLNCRYSGRLMKQIAELSAGIGNDYNVHGQSRLKRTLINATDANKSNIIGLTKAKMDLASVDSEPNNNDQADVISFIKLARSGILKSNSTFNCHSARDATVNPVEELRPFENLSISVKVEQEESCDLSASLNSEPVNPWKVESDEFCDYNLFAPRQIDPVKTYHGNYFNTESVVNSCDLSVPLKTGLVSQSNLFLPVKMEPVGSYNLSASWETEPGVICGVTAPLNPELINSCNLSAPLNNELIEPSNLSALLNIGPCNPCNLSASTKSSDLGSLSVTLKTESVKSCALPSSSKINLEPYNLYRPLKIEPSESVELSASLKTEPLEPCDILLPPEIESAGAYGISAPLTTEPVKSCDLSTLKNESVKPYVPSAALKIESLENNTADTFAQIDKRLRSDSTFDVEPEKLTSEELQDVLNNWNCYSVLSSTFTYAKLKLNTKANQDKSTKKWACRLCVQIRKDIWILGTCVGINYKTAKHLAARDAIIMIMGKNCPVKTNSENYTYSTYSDFPSGKEATNSQHTHSHIKTEVGESTLPPFVSTLRNKMLTLIREVLKCGKQFGFLASSSLSPEEKESIKICLDKQEDDQCMNVEESTLKSCMLSSYSIAMDKDTKGWQDTSSSWPDESSLKLRVNTENTDANNTEDKKCDYTVKVKEEETSQEPKGLISDQIFNSQQEKLNSSSTSAAVVESSSRRNSTRALEFYHCMALLKAVLRKCYLRMMIESKVSGRKKRNVFCALTVTTESKTWVFGSGEGKTFNRARNLAATRAVKRILEKKSPVRWMKDIGRKVEVSLVDIVEWMENSDKDSKFSLVDLNVKVKKEELDDGDNFKENLHLNSDQIDQTLESKGETAMALSITVAERRERRELEMNLGDDAFPLDLVRLRKQLMGMIKGLLHKYNKRVRNSKPFDSFDWEEKLVKVTDDEVYNQMIILLEDIESDDYRRIFARTPPKKAEPRAMKEERENDDLRSRIKKEKDGENDDLRSRIKKEKDGENDNLRSRIKKEEDGENDYKDKNVYGHGYGTPLASETFNFRKYLTTNSEKKVYIERVNKEKSSPRYDERSSNTSFEANHKSVWDRLSNYKGKAFNLKNMNM